MPKKASEKLKEKLKGSSTAKRRVAKLAKSYKDAQKELDEYQAEYEDILQGFENLAVERNIALDRLKRACKDAQISAGPFTIKVQHKRTFDGSYLYSTLDDEIRDKIVTVEYKVQPKMFDQYVQSGQIDPKTAQKSIAAITEVPIASGGPKEIVMG